MRRTRHTTATTRNLTHENSRSLFYERSFAGVSMGEFIDLLDEYLVWYRDKRIKTEFGMSIMDRRRGLGLVA